MSQLHVLQFDKIGPLRFESNENFSLVDEMVQMRVTLTQCLTGTRPGLQHLPPGPLN